MSKDERLIERDREIDALIDKYDMTSRCSLTREQIHRKVLRGMVLNNLSFILADVVNTLVMDMESELSVFGIGLSQQEKYNFKQMFTHLQAARKWSEKCALPIYALKETDNACADSDWWHNLILLIDDRLGDDCRKTNMFLEYLLAMPSEVDLFKIKYDDFKRFNIESE